jgi:tetratricopeptide (TPR) repeat protein
MNSERSAGLSSDATPTQTGHGAASELRSGEVLADRFRIESLIGIGGMGVVYRARDLSLDIDVALKLLRPELARRPEAFANFRRELLLARQVSSPHVVRIHDIAEHAGRWFISMDHIDGESLEQRRDREHRQPPEQALAITRGLLEGLVAAHQRGVVHRDLKPANILLGEGDHPYITDFGVARILGATGMSQTGTIVGTPQYLSPEQARGIKVDARSDLYTLGLILYEMLAGELPFAGGTPAESVVQRILRPPPSLAEARPDLPRWLHAFSDRLLKVNPAHRFESARHALQALDAQRVPRPPLNRRRLASILSGVVLVAAAAFWIWQHPQPWRDLIAPSASAAPRVGVLPLATQPSNDVDLQVTARAIEEHLRQWLRSDAAVSAVLRRRMLDATARAAPDMQGETLLRQLPEVANAAGASRLLRGQLRREGETFVLELHWDGADAIDDAVPLQVNGADPSQLFQAYQAAAPAWLQAAGFAPGSPPRIAPAVVSDYGRALLEIDRGESEQAATTLAQMEALNPPGALRDLALLDAQESARQLLSAQDTRDRVLQAASAPDSAPEQTLRIRALAESDDADALRQALDLALKRFPHDPELALLNAQVLADQGDGAAALNALRDYVGSDQQDARAWFLLGRTSIVQGQAQPAVDEYLLRALVLNTRARNTAAEAETRNALGIGYERLGQLDAAVEQYQRAAEMREAIGDSIGLGRTLRNLAIVQAQQGDRESAEANLLRVKAMLEQQGDRASLADLHNDRGVIAEERGDFVAALGAYREALGLRQQLDVPDLVAESLNNVAFSSLQLGQYDNALVYWQQALTLYRQLDSPDRMLGIELSIGLLDIARGHLAEARTRLEASLRDAEDRQLPEEASVGHVNLAELSLLEGRLAEALDHAARAQQLAIRRTDLRTEIEARLLQGRAACALGDMKGIDAALTAIPAEIVSNEQTAMRLMIDACRARLAGDFGAALAHLDTAAQVAADAHSGKLIADIQLGQLHLALAGGDRDEIARKLQTVRGNAAQLRALSQQVEWQIVQMAAALRTHDTTDAATRYREALGLIKGIEPLAEAYMLHRLGALALAGNGSEAAAAKAAASAARKRLLDGAPADLRPLLEAWQERRVHEEAVTDRAR